MNDRSQRKDSFFEKEKRGRKKNFPFTEKEFVRVEEFVNSFPNQSEFLSFFFRRFLITSSPLREKSSKREKCLLERGKTGERRRQTCRRKSVINSTEGEEFVERREREKEGIAGKTHYAKSGYYHGCKRATQIRHKPRLSF